MRRFFSFAPQSRRDYPRRVPAAEENRGATSLHCSPQKKLLLLILFFCMAFVLLATLRSEAVRRLRRSDPSLSAFGIPRAPRQHEMEAKLSAVRNIIPSIPTYYINLEESKERRYHLEQRLAELEGTGLVHLNPQRFPAIKPGMPGEIEFSNKFPSTSPFLLPTERACYASHTAVLRRIADDPSLSDDNFVLVLEDDAVYRDGDALHIATILSTVVKTAPPCVGLVQLSSIGSQRNLIVQHSEISDRTEEYLDALAYILNEPLDQSMAGAAVAFLIRKWAARDFLHSQEYGTFVFDTDLRDNAYAAAQAKRWTAFRFVRDTGLGGMSGVVVNNMTRFPSNINTTPVSKELKHLRDKMFRHKG